MADYLQDQWLPSLHDLRPITRLSYETLTRLPIVPHIGSVQLAKLTIRDCESLGSVTPPPCCATLNARTLNTRTPGRRDRKQHDRQLGVRPPLES